MTTDNFNILLVDNEQEQLGVLSAILESEGYRVDTAADGQIALSKLKTKSFDLVVTDLVMGELDGIGLLERIKADDEETEVIIITGYGSVANAVEAMKKGAFSYFIKGNPPDELLLEIKKVYKLARLRNDNAVLRLQPRKNRVILETRSRLFSELLNFARKAAQSNAHVLLTGESGVGKEVISEYIHNLSSRRDNLFYPINCHALSESLLEEELFGHEKGTFTGADRSRKGKFEAAHGGTLLLDEIGDIPHHLQAKLLRVIETREVQRIGGHKNIPVDFRLLAATNCNLSEAVLCGRFRADLYYRLCVIHIHIPPLRERREDIRMLAEFFLDKCNWEMKRHVEITDQAVWTFLEQYDYPGNIRQLRNIVEQLVVLSETGVIDRQILEKTHLAIPMESGADPTMDPEKETTNLKAFRKQTEKKHIKRILDLAGQNKHKTADMLGISVRQLFNKISEYDL